MHLVTEWKPYSNIAPGSAPTSYEHHLASAIGDIMEDLRTIAADVNGLRHDAFAAEHQRKNLQSENTRLTLENRDLKDRIARLQRRLDEALESSVVTMSDAESAEIIVSLESKLEKEHTYIETLEQEVADLRQGIVPSCHISLERLDD